jgi:probable HAF family extracellular repeat protein
MRDLGTLGGNFGTAFSISEAGDIVGWATTPGDQAIHGFLWKQGQMLDLDVIQGKFCSVAYAINSKRQVVGSSNDCAGGNAHAFFWEEGSLVDLNLFVSSSSGVLLTFALSINERGEIASLGLLPNGDQHAFELIPCDDGESQAEGCEEANEIRAAAIKNAAGDIAPARAAVVQPNLTPSEMKDRVRAF